MDMFGPQMNFGTNNIQMETPQTLYQTRKETHDMFISNGTDTANLFIHSHILIRWLPYLWLNPNKCFKYDTYEDKLNIKIESPLETLKKFRDFVYFEKTIPDENLLTLAKNLNCRSLINYCTSYLNKREKIINLLLEKNEEEIENILKNKTEKSASINISSLAIPLSECKIDFGTEINPINFTEDTLPNLYIKCITKNKNAFQDENLYLYGEKDLTLKIDETHSTHNYDFKGYTESSLKKEIPDFEGFNFDKIFHKVEDCKFNVYRLMPSNELRKYFKSSIAMRNLKIIKP